MFSEDGHSFSFVVVGFIGGRVFLCDVGWLFFFNNNGIQSVVRHLSIP